MHSTTHNTFRLSIFLLNRNAIPRARKSESRTKKNTPDLGGVWVFFKKYPGVLGNFFFSRTKFGLLTYFLEQTFLAYVFQNNPDHFLARVRARGTYSLRGSCVSIELSEHYCSAHRWSSGRILPCHGRDPGSIPGRCTHIHQHEDFSAFRTFSAIAFLFHQFLAPFEIVVHSDQMWPIHTHGPWDICTGMFLLWQRS